MGFRSIRWSLSIRTQRSVASIKMTANRVVSSCSCYLPLAHVSTLRYWRGKQLEIKNLNIGKIVSRPFEYFWNSKLGRVLKFPFEVGLKKNNVTETLVAIRLWIYKNQQGLFVFPVTRNFRNKADNIWTDRASFNELEIRKIAIKKWYHLSVFGLSSLRCYA